MQIAETNSQHVNGVLTEVTPSSLGSGTMNSRRYLEPSPTLQLSAEICTPVPNVPSSAVPVSNISSQGGNNTEASYQNALTPAGVLLLLLPLNTVSEAIQSTQPQSTPEEDCNSAVEGDEIVMECNAFVKDSIESLNDDETPRFHEI